MYIRAFCERDQEDWPTLVFLAKCCYNSMVSRTTKKMLFYLCYKQRLCWLVYYLLVRSRLCVSKKNSWDIIHWMRLNGLRNRKWYSAMLRQWWRRLKTVILAWWIKNVWGSIESGRKGLVGLEELWNIHGIIHQVVRNVDLCVSNKKILHLDVCVLVLGKRGGKSWHPVIYVSLFQKYHRDEKDVLVAKLSATTTIIRVMDWCGWQGDGLTTSTRRSE